MARIVQSGQALFVAASALLAAYAAFAAVAAAAEPPTDSCAVADSGPCVIELHGPRAPAMSANCAAEPWSRYLKPMLPGRLVDSDKNGWWEAVVEIALDPAKACGCAKLRLYFEEPVSGWWVNIGDSPTNNGYGGDGGTTNFSAELEMMMIAKQSFLSVYTAATPSFGNLRFDRIFQSELPELGGRHADVEVCDQVLTFDMADVLAGHRRLHWTLQTPVLGVLYSFAPRPSLPESERTSSKDKGVYAGFNRVISKPGSESRSRNGTGLRRVEITLSP